MKEIVIISGKGGTGKTSLVASIASMAEKKVLADCDVDAADLYLVLEPDVLAVNEFSGGKKARIIEEECTGCGKCIDVCRFEAIAYPQNADHTPQMVPQINSISCEGCGVCVHVCQDNAIEFEPAINGQWFISDTRYGPMVHARLGMAEGNSGKLVSLIREEARKIAERDNLDFIIIDGSPGIGCPVISSITGADLVVVVTEPTLSGQHDMNRVAQLTSHFQIPTTVCINKWDLNPEIAQQIESQADKQGIQSIGRIRYDAAVTKAQIMKSSVVEYTGSAIAEDIRSVWRNIIYALG